MSEQSVVVDVDLGINTVNVLLGGDGPGVHLDLSRVKFNEHLVEFKQLIDTLFSQLSSWELQ